MSVSVNIMIDNDVARYAYELIDKNPGESPRSLGELFEFLVMKERFPRERIERVECDKADGNTEPFSFSMAVSKSTLEDMATESIFEYIEDIFQYEPDKYGHYYLALIAAYNELVNRFSHAKKWTQNELTKCVESCLVKNHE